MIASPPHLAVTPELFAIPSKDHCILYAPLKGVALLANRAAAQWLARYQTDPDPLVQTPLYQQFADAGILEVAGTTRLPDLSPKAPYEPTDVILLTTTSCNLRCVYCYASAGTRTIPFRPEVARAAIRLAISNAIAQGKTVSHLAFHGGGEPTMALPFIKNCVAYAHEQAGNRVKVLTSIVTNGYLNQRQAEWLAKNVQSIQVSLDGPASIHDEQRPLQNGHSSFERVRTTIRYLEQEGVPDLLVKATIAQQHVHDMPEIARFLCENFAARRFHLGPVLNNGRSLATGYSQPTVEAFVQYAKQAQEVARSYNREVVVSLAQTTFPKLRLAFCGLTDPNFAVSVEGKVTGCYEVIYADDPRARHFHFGEYVPESDSFSFSNERMDALQGRIMPNLDRCKHCFARWHCGGDCHIRMFDETTGDESMSKLDFRCQVNRALVREELLKVVASHGQIVRFEPTLTSEQGIR
ncbi:MAG: radical SAM protein [Chloroflexales bacterium]